MVDCTYKFTDAGGKERVIKGQAAFKAYLADGGLQHLMPNVAFSRVQPLTPEEVLKPKTIAAAKAAIAKYKKGEPPDPLTTKERAYGEKLMKPLFDAANRNKDAFDKTLDRIAEGMNSYAKKPAVKKPYRAVTKLAMENAWDTVGMKDLLRGTIVVATPEDAQQVIGEIGKVYKFDRIKNRLSIDLANDKGETVEGKPLSTGYQDVLTNVVLPDGTIAEIQISTPAMLAAKNLGHEIYAFEREVEEGPIKTKMVEIQKQIYSEGANFGRAANASNTRLNSALSTGSAFSRTSEGLRGEGVGTQAVADRQSGETVTGTSFQSKNMVSGAKESKSNFIGTSGLIIPESIGINVNQDGENQYADKIVDGEKTLETRTSDSLRPYVGKRVAIVRTGDGPAKAIGAVTIGKPIKVTTQKQFDQYRDQTLIPKDSKFDIAPGQTKYMYPLENPVRYSDERDVGQGIVARKVMLPSRAGQKNAAASRVEGTSADRFKRTEQLQQAVANLQDGKITRPEYNRMVDELRPVQPYAAVPAVTTPKDARYALENGRGQSAEKAAKYGVPSMTLKSGDWAQLRLDIPSYQEHDAWVVSVHTPKSTNREVQSAYDAGPVVGYESVAALTDVTFGMNQKAAAKIATGSAKGTIATMLGKWSPISKADAMARADAAMNDPAWTQVGMDPFRHSYFYDRDTMRPVLSADEVIQVGPLVLAKNVKFGLDTDVTGAPIAFSSKQKPEFYSQLSRVIGGVPDRLATMPAQQWKAWIDSNSAKLGVKKDEIEWSGIKDYLDLRGKDKVTRADLVDYLDQNGVRVTETVLGGKSDYSAMSDKDLRSEYRRIRGYAPEDSDGVAMSRFEIVYELEGALERDATSTKYGQYTLPGGKNYRELLLTLPIKEKPTWLKFLGKRDLTLDRYEELPLEDRRRLTAEYMELESETYDSSHWAEKNVLAHIRLNDRTDADGKRVLFVEEVQSDWGQQGKKSGFANAALRAELEKEIRALGIKKSMMNISIRDLKESGANDDLQDRFRKEMLTGAMRVLPAPFIGKTEGWLNLALKRITMMAVEGGYDKVAFVNGEQSAERYSLAEQIDSMIVGKENDGSYSLVASQSGREVVKRDNVPEGDLEGLVGKEMAQRIIDGGGKDIGQGEREFAGLDLKVGGEGMKTFYDQIVPQNLSKLLPKIGGEKMGTVSVMGERDNDPLSGEDVMNALGIPNQDQDSYWANLSYAERDKLTEDYRQSSVKPMPQPGFDVTDSMRETVGQGLPMFSKRQPVGKETEGWLLSRDELGRFRFGAGAKAYRAAADVASNVLDLVGLKPVSPELSRAMRKMRMEIDKAQNLTVDVAKNMKDLPEQERQMVSDVIEGELKRGAKPPQRVLEIAASMQDIMSEQSAELVRLGMLSPEAAGRWDGKYLPRFYEQKLGDEAKAWMKAVKGLLGRKKTMQGIGGSSLKARGMFESVPVADLADWEANGWAVRDDAFNPAVDTEITVWRDYTRKERDDMGEIRDSMFRFVMGYNKSQRDIALGRLYESLASNYASKTEKEGYVQVPATNVENTFAKRYGKLADKWVPAEILDQLVAFDTTMQNDLTKIYLKGLSMWKEGKTVLNPVAHANNILSNLTMAHFAGVSYWDGHKYVGAIADLVKGNAMVDEAKEAGLFGGTFNRAELMDAMPEPLRALAQMSESKAKQSVDMIWNALSLFLRKPMGKAYSAEDDFFRYMVYRDARNKGLNPDDAVDYSLKYMFSYDDMPKGARFLRDMPLGLPFFSYTYKVVPALANTALEHPFRYAAPAVAIYTANAIMYSIAASLGGGEDEEWWTVIQRYITDPDFREQVKDMEKQERKNLPPWMKGASLSLGTEKSIRLGMDDLTNMPVFLDISRMFPGGDLFDAHNNAGGVPLLAPITPNSPILTIASAMLFNKDTFRGQELVTKTDTSAEAAQKRLTWMWKQMTPAIAVGNTHFERAMNVIANVTGNPVNVGLAEYTGIGKDGVPVTPGYAALQTVGIKARPIDLDTSEKIQKSQTKGLIRELDIQIKKLQRLENKGAISSDTAEAEKEKLREKKQNLREGLTLEGEEKE